MQRITVGSNPTGVAAGAGAVWVANSGEQTITRIDPRSGHPTTIDVHADPTELVVGAGAVWMTSSTNRTVSQLDPRSGRVVQPIQVGGGPSGIAVGHDAVWVANSLDGTVSRINPTTGAVAATIPVGNGPNAIAIARDGVWVSEQFGGVVDRIDPKSNHVVQSVAVGNRPTGLALAGGRLWVGARASGLAHRGGTLRVLGSPIDSIDPALAYSTASIPFVALTGDGLTAVQHAAGRDGTQIVPDLAITLPTQQDGGRSYRFVLRRGIRYSNGADVRAGDVRPSFERLWKLRPFMTQTSPGPDFFADIVGASQCTRAPRTCDLSRGIVTDPGNDSVVTFHLTHPDPEFLNKLALQFAFILPAGTPPASPTCVGCQRPARTRWRATSAVTGSCSPATRISASGRRPLSPTATPTASTCASTSRYLARSMRSYAGRPTTWGACATRCRPSASRELLTQHASQTHIEPLPADIALFLNTHMPPFDDVRVRRALELRHQSPRRGAGRGGSTAAAPTCQILPPNFPGYVRYCPYHAPDMRIARRLIAASGTRACA